MGELFLLASDRAAISAVTRSASCRRSARGERHRLLKHGPAKGRSAGADHDRRHTSESALHGGGLNFKLHIIYDSAVRSLAMLLTEGQMSDHKGARLMCAAVSESLLGDREYDYNWFGAALL
ncbi:transposase [Phyllobacterium sophorae]|nr:transposase [Phyllobacterium sophorae]